MLREGVARPANHQNVSSREMFFGVSAPQPQRPTLGHDSDPEPEDYVPPPPKANIGDLLAQALEMSTLKDEGATSSSSGSGKKKGRKMKGQKINLTGGGGRAN
jgi:hypothetical protein